jgi:hypothetical protein
MGDSDPRLDALDRATLAPIVQRALDCGPVELLDWHWAPIAYYMFLPRRLVARCSGQAQVEGALVPWSMVLKLSHRPDSTVDTRSDYREREVLAYQSGLLSDLPGPLVAPRALAVIAGAESESWLWLEDVADSYGGQWPPAQYRHAAYHLGLFNGAYLVGRPIPTFSWLVPHWPELHSEPAKIPPALAEIETLAADPRVRHVFPAPMAAQMPQLLRDQARFMAILDRLPHTLCHHDASQANLFARMGASGEMQTVAIDWESLGPGTAGAEIATLVFGTVRRGLFPADQVADLSEDVFAGYLQGLRDTGWQGNADLVRLGYTAAVALRWFLLHGTLRALTGLKAQARRGQALHENEEQALHQFILLSTFLLVCAAEARTLARRDRFSD